jgi:hypothetical protein
MIILKMKSTVNRTEKRICKLEGISMDITLSKAQKFDGKY